MRVAGLVWAPHREHKLTIKQPCFACPVVLHTESDAERSRAEEVNLGRNSQFGGQQSGDGAAEPDPSQATNVAVDDD